MSAAAATVADVASTFINTHTQNAGGHAHFLLVWTLFFPLFSASDVAFIVKKSNKQTNPSSSAKKRGTSKN